MRYGAVGAIALAGDVGTLVFLTENVGVYYLWSAAIAFCVGVAIHYTFSVLWVFRVRRVENRLLEFAIFGVIGLVGLLLTQLTMWTLTEQFQIPYLVSKGASAGLVFLWNFFARKMALFS